METVRWPGRLEWISLPTGRGGRRRLLVDGAHNPAAANGLRGYVDGLLDRRRRLRPGSAVGPVHFPPPLPPLPPLSPSARGGEGGGFPSGRQPKYRLTTTRAEAPAAQTA
jgi:hypothetical protein